MPENIDRIETNLQIAHAPKSAKRDFRTDYLLKVFRYDAPARLFAEAPMENQIDRERILADAGLARDFKAWLLDRAHFAELDRGTILIPEKFLAKAAIAPTPVGFAPSNLLPEFGLSEGEGEQSRVQRRRCRRRAEEGGGRRHGLAEHPLLRRLPAAAQRHHLRRLSPDPRHRRLPFSRRRLDGGKAVQLHRGAGLAAFLRRPGASPRHPCRAARRPHAGLFQGVRQPPAIARCKGAGRHRI